MKMIQLKTLFAVVAVGAMAVPVIAQTTQSPTAPIASAPATEPKAPSKPVVAPSAAGTAFAAPSPAAVVTKTDKSEPAAALKYRDPSKPLTIGEMSDIQAAQEAEKFFKKHGFTTLKPEVAKTGSGGKGDGKDAKPLPPLNTLRLVGVYGVPGKLRADLQLNGALYPVDRPTGLGRAQVRAIDAAGVEVVLPRPAKATAKCSKKALPECKTPETVHRLRVGDVVEWR